MSVIKPGIMVLFVIVANVVAAFVQTGTATTPTTFATCGHTGNFTSCETVSKTSFFNNLLSVTVSGFDNPNGFLALTIFNILWVLMNVFLLTLAVIEFFRQFGPTLPGG